MAIDPDLFSEMFASAENLDSDDSISEPADLDEPPLRRGAAASSMEPPVRGAMIEPPIRREEPPPSRQELEQAAADELLKIAAQEEKDLQNLRKTQRSKDTFLIHCPKGCQIRVKEQHRGKTGKCPRCQSEFVVPKKPAPKKPD